MNSVFLLLLGAFLFLIAYFNYGGFLNDLWGINPKKITLSYTKFDRKEYVPTKRRILLSQHFGAIAGAGAVAGPIQAAVFGWVPAYLWIIIGAIFFGAAMDFSTIYVSMKSNGKSIGSLIEDSSGKLGSRIFKVCCWAVIIFLISAFISIIGTAFEEVPGAATASAYFVIIAVIYGVLVYKLKLNTALSTVISVVLVFGALILGYKYPFIKLDKNIWYVVLLIYVFLTSVIPEWTVEPRDYLNSFITYTLIIASVAGLLITRPYTQVRPIIMNQSSNGVGMLYLFPMLFVLMGCGAVSGFHSIVSSNFTAKKVENEKDIRPIGYGSMLLEGLVAIIALLSVVCAQNADKIHIDANTAPIQMFSQGIGNIMSGINIPEDFAVVFATFAFSALALSGINTAARLVKHIFDEKEYIRRGNSDFKQTGIKRHDFILNSFKKLKINKGHTIIILVTVLMSAAMLYFSYQKIWILFGIANEEVAALTLSAVSVWLVKSRKNELPALIPMIIIAIISLGTLTVMSYNFIVHGSFLLLIITLLITIAPLYPIINAVMSMVRLKKEMRKMRISPK